MKKDGFFPNKQPSLADTLRKYRIAAGFTQKSVAEALGISRSAYTYYETGKTSPDPATLNRISKIFKVPLELFFYEEEHPGTVMLYDSGVNSGRAPKKSKIDPQKVGELTGSEKALIAYLRSRNISGDSVLEKLKRFYDSVTRPDRFSR